MTPRSLVGMTQGARKRAWLAGSIDAIVFTDGIHTDDLEIKSAYSWSEIRRWWQPFGWQLLGQRLRPCPGCQKCGSSVRRFAPTAGWKSPRKWIIWDGAKLWMIARTWRRLCTVPTLADYTSGVDDGTWKELFCDGSGVLPAKGKARPCSPK